MSLKHLIHLSTLLLGISFLPLSGMQQLSKAKEESSHLQAAPLTKWPNSTYDNAYQGATYNFSQNERHFVQTGILAIKMTKEQAQKDTLDAEGRVILDWFHALQRTELDFLQKDFGTWPLEDLKTLSACLTRLDKDVPVPGAFRTKQSNWQLEDANPHVWTYVTFLAQKKHYAANPAELEIDRKDPQFAPDWAVPLTDEEEARINTYIYFFPSKDEIERELTAALLKTQEALAGLKGLPFEERQQRALSIGCAFHFNMVRIHPFDEGSKRLGRLCMYIIHAQHGIKPCTITHGQGYVRSLIESLKQKSSLPFEQFIRSCFEQNKPTIKPAAQSKTSASPKTKASPAVQTATYCAHCKKEGTKLQQCSRCKSVAYCDKVCQANHWKAGHKATCIPPVSNDSVTKK